MATAVDICNLALGRLGDEANISSIDPPDDSVQANYCNRFYPQALLASLDKHNWTFSKRRFMLVERANESTEWEYCFSIPTDMNNVIELLKDGQPIDQFEMELASDDTYVIYANDTGLQIVYNSSSVNPATFPPAFVDYLSMVLAYYLSGPILKGDVGAAAAKTFLQMAIQGRAIAIASDSQNFNSYQHYIPESIRARNGILTNNTDNPYTIYPSGINVY